MLFCDGGWRWRRDGGGRGVPVGPPAGSTSPDRRRRGRWNRRPRGEAGRGATLYNYRRRRRRRRRRSLLAVSARIGEPAHTGARRRRSPAPLARDLDSLVAAAGRASARRIPPAVIMTAYWYTATGRLGSRVASVLDSGTVGPGFKSQPRRCRVTVLGKVFTPIVPLFTKQQNWQQRS